MKGDDSIHDFTLDSMEGLPIRCTLRIPHPARGVVVIIHGFKGFREWGFFPWLTGQLAEHGLAACRFDMSRNGIGDDPETFERLDLFADDTYSTQLNDLRVVVESLRQRSELADLPFFLLGHSRGGAIALLAASELRFIQAIVTWSAIADLNRWDEKTISSWRQRGHEEIVNSRTGQVMKVSTRLLDDLATNSERLDLEKNLRELQTPLLIVHGSADETVEPSEARRIAEAVIGSSTLLVGGASHTMNAIHPLITVPDALSMAARASAHFILSHCSMRQSMLRHHHR